MAINYLTPFSEARRCNADGSYTDQKVIALPNNTSAAIYGILHDLERQPDWVRVTRLAIDTLAPAAYLNPVIQATVDPASGRFLWEDTVVADVQDLNLGLLFAAYAANRTPAKLCYFLVEFGLTHSTSK